MKKVLSALCASTMALSTLGVVSFADTTPEPSEPAEPRQVAVTDFGAQFYVMGIKNWNWASAGEGLFNEEGKWTAKVDVAAVANASKKEDDESVGRAGVQVYFCEGEYFGEDAQFTAKLKYEVTDSTGETSTIFDKAVLFTVVKKGSQYEAITGDTDLVLGEYGSSWDDLIKYGTVDMTVTMTNLKQIAEGKHPSDDSSTSDDSSQTDPTPTPAAKKSLAKAKVKASNKTYSGKAVRPTVKVTLDGKTLASGKDYTPSFKNNKKCGKATVTVTGKGDYTGTKSGSFIIKPKKAAAKKLTSKKAGTVKFTWKKSAGGVTGYQVQIANNKKFSKAKTYKIKKASTTSKTIKKLTSKKTYFARVRAFKTVGKKNYNGAWSKAKSVKVK